MSRRYGVSEAAIGLVLIAVATSLPEMAVAASAVIEGAPEITVGNLVGASISNLALITGMSALIAPILIRRELLGGLSTILFLTSLFPLILVNVPAASKWIGATLLATFGIYAFNTLKTRTPIETDQNRPWGWWVVPSFVLGLAAVIVSSGLVVDAAASVAAAAGVSKAVIGATIVSVGTTLPELTVSLRAMIKKRSELALGNILGSGMTNLGLILGLVLLGAPGAVNFATYGSLIAFLLAGNLVVWYLIVRGSIRRLEGAALLVFYIVFVTSQFIAVPL
jgi:cation:H+ antiporter